MKPLGISDHSFNLSFSEQSKSSSYPSVSHQDRRTYKNLSIYITELPPTPKLFRDKYHRTREPGVGLIRRKPQYTAAVCNQGRPQTNQMVYVSGCLVPVRPYTLGFIDTEGAAPSEGRRREDTSQYEIALEEMMAATLDQDYKNELSAIEKWFGFLSHGERTASLYALAQQTTQVQIGLLLHVLQQMTKNHPMSL